MAQVQSALMSTMLDDRAVEALRNEIRGELLQPGDTNYDTARVVWNAMIDRRPAVIVRCAGTADVISAVNFARDNGLLVSIRGGGHNVAGVAVCEGGLMIDLSHMKSVRVDPLEMTARAEPGVLWEEFDHESQVFGLATVGGTVSTTGIAGLTLGGGVGWLTGKYGLTIDNLLSADVITANGHLLHASAHENSDLFWAVRGAGANFGVVTSFEYRLHPVSAVLGGMVIHPFDRAREILRFYREFSVSQPDELTTYAAILVAPDGNRVIALIACYVGAIDEGERVLAPLRRFRPPVTDTIAPIRYTDMQAILSQGCPPGRLNYWKSGLTSQISDEAIETIVEHCQSTPSPDTAVVLTDCHGAYSRVEPTETAYCHRDLQYDLIVLSSWTDPADSERNIRWTRELLQDVEPYLARGLYVNDLDHDEGAERIRNAYGENYERLVALKRKYDPTNLFRMNQNIRPMVSMASE